MNHPPTSLLDLVFKQPFRGKDDNNEDKNHNHNHTLGQDKGSHRDTQHDDQDEDNEEEEDALVHPIANKEEFVSSVREWIILEKQMRLVQEKSRELRQKKTAITDRLCEFMEDKNIADKPIQIQGQGQLQWVERKDYSPLTFSYVEERLAEILEDEDQIDFIVSYLRDHREINVYSDLKLVNKVSRYGR